MAQIPLIPGLNPLPNLPGAVLDRERRPTVDNSNLAAAVDRLGKSSAQPMVPDSLAAPFKALGAIGDAVAQAGDVVSAIAMQHQRNQDTIAINDADTKRDAALAEFNLAREKEPDPSKWSGLFDTYAQKAIGEISKGKMSNRAREEIGRRNDRWMKLTRIEVARASVSKTADQARQINENGLELAIQTQNQERFDAELKDGIVNLRINEHTAGLYRERYRRVGEQLALERKGKAFKDALNIVTDATRTNGVDAVIRDIESDTLGSFDAQEKLTLTTTARQAGREQSARVMESVMNGIASGDIQHEAEIECLTYESPHVPPMLLKQMKEELVRSRSVAQADAEDRRLHGDRNSLDLFERIRDAQPTGDDAQDKATFFALSSEVRRRVPEEHQGLLGQLLHQKYWAKPPQLQPRDEVMLYFHEQLASMYHPVSGRIPYRKTGQTETSSKDPFSGITTTTRQDTVVEDADRREQALREKTELMRFLNDEARKHPEKFQRLEDAHEQLLQVLPKGEMAGAVEALRMALEPHLKARKQALATAPREVGSPLGKVTYYGYPGDTTPDRNSLAGIGAFTTPGDAKGDRTAPTRLRPGDVAVSPDVEKTLRAAGLKERDHFYVHLANKERRLVRWMDRTASDREIEEINQQRVKEGKTQLPVMRGRIDFYQPWGKDDRDGMQVVNWEVPEEIMQREARKKGR